MEMGTRGPDAPVEYGEEAEVVVPVEGDVRYGCCPKRCNKCCSHLPESLRPCCLPGQECCVNCCYNPGKLDQLYYGGFYWSRDVVVGFVGVLLSMCIAGDYLLAASMAKPMRQAKKTVKAISTLCEIGEDYLDLNEDFWGTYEDIFEVESDVKCAGTGVRNQVEALAANCTYDEAALTKFAVGDFWNASETWFSKIENENLNCSASRPFWEHDVGQYAVSKQCQVLCRLQDDVVGAQSAYANLSVKEWFVYAEALSSSVVDLTSTLVGLEDAMNSVVADAGISDYTCQAETAMDSGSDDGSSSSCPEGETLGADTYFDFARRAQAVATKVGEAAVCLDKLYVDGNATNAEMYAYSTQWDARKSNYDANCDDYEILDQMASTAGNVKKMSKLIRNYLKLTDTFADMFMDLPIDVVVALYADGGRGLRSLGSAGRHQRSKRET